MKQIGTWTSRTSSSARNFGPRRMRQSNRGRFNACEKAMWRWIVKGLIRGLIIAKSATGEISKSEVIGIL